jgi:hypothetical protein
MQGKAHAPPSLGGACLEDVEGFTSASPRQSLTTAAGALRLDPIEGVRYRLARPVSHHHGHLTEAFRADWGADGCSRRSGQSDHYVPRSNPGVGASPFHRRPLVCGDRLALRRLP